MKISIYYSKKNLKFLVRIKKSIFINFYLNKFINIDFLKNISLIMYNYILLLKILRMYGFLKPLKNIKDF